MTASSTIFTNIRVFSSIKLFRITARDSGRFISSTLCYFSCRHGESDRVYRLPLLKSCNACINLLFIPFQTLAKPSLVRKSFLLQRRRFQPTRWLLSCICRLSKYRGPSHKRRKSTECHNVQHNDSKWLQDMVQAACDNNRGFCLGRLDGHFQCPA